MQTIPPSSILYSEIGIGSVSTHTFTSTSIKVGCCQLITQPRDTVDHCNAAVPYRPWVCERSIHTAMIAIERHLNNADSDM